MTKRVAPRFPARKISETLLAFAAPIMRDLPSEAREQRARQALELAFTIWNAVVCADVLNDQEYLAQIRKLTAGNPEAGVLVENMIARKRELFADDERIIGEWEVTRTEDGINVHTDARDPFSLPRHPTPDRRFE